MAENKIKQLITTLENLSDEEKEVLKSLLNKESEPKAQTKRKGPPEHVRKKIVTDISETTSKPKKRRVVKLEPDEDDEDEQPRKGRRGNRQGGRILGARGESIEGTKCREEPVQIRVKRENKFINSPEFGAAKKFVKEDKEAWARQGKQMKPRTRVAYVEVTCKKCRKTFEVGVGLARKNFVCDGCITRE